MILIGVTGMSGAGKTTFSDYLQKNKRDIGVIHIDDFLKEIKLKYFKLFMKKSNKGEKTKVDSRLKKFIYRNKYIFVVFMKFKAMLIEPLLNRKIEEMKSKRIIIIDDTFIKYHSVYKKFKKIYLLKRAYVDRKKALIDRDGLSKEEVLAYDIAHYSGNYREIKHDERVITIVNNGDEEQLRKKAQLAYEYMFLSDRERLLKRTKVNLNGKMRPKKNENKTYEEISNIELKKQENFR